MRAPGPDRRDASHRAFSRPRSPRIRATPAAPPGKPSARCAAEMLRCQPGGDHPSQTAQCAVSEMPDLAVRW
jgi:hypothetical protein